MATSLQAQAITLTEDEQNFIRQHPVLLVGNEMDWPPFDFNENGQPKGLSIDYLRLLAEKAGLNLEFISGHTWPVLLQMFRNRELHILPVLYRNQEREAFTHFTRPYYQTKLALFTLDKSRLNPDLSNLHELRVGIQKADGAIPRVRKQYPGIALIQESSSETLIQKLALDELDVIIGNPALFAFLARKNQLGKLYLSAYIETATGTHSSLALHIGVRNDWPVLASILEKAMDEVSPAEINRLEKQWNPLVISSNPQPEILLSTEEEAYLNRKSGLVYCINPDWMPYEGLSANNKIQGMSADYINLISERLGRPLVLHQTSNLQESIQAINNNHCDLMPLLEARSDTLGFLNFTQPYLTVPYVIATREQQAFIDNFADHLSKTFAVLRGSAIAQKLQQQHNDIQIQEVESVAAGLEAVRQGKVFGYIDAASVIEYQLRHLDISKVAITGQLEQKLQLSVASSQNEPLLHGLMKKVVASLSNEDKNRIYNKWLTIKTERITDYTLLLQTLIAALLLIGLFVYWNRKLRLSQQITEQTLSELQTTKKQLEEQNRFKSDFLANMSHEIRTPMNAILGMAYLAGQRAEDKMLRQQIDTIHSSAKSLLGIINDILDLSKIEAGHIQIEHIVFDLDELLKQVTDINQHVATTREIIFTIQRSEDLPARLIGDPTRLKQIMLNLISNAMKFTDSGGSVTIKLSHKVLSDLEIELCISVIDTGIGMTRDQLDRIFQPFTQADSSTTRNYGGTGLGLSISQHLTDIMNGRLWAESEPHKGSRFHLSLIFSLPQDETLTEAFATTPPATDAAAENFDAILQGHQVLLVEDNEINQVLAEEVLTQAGLVVKIAENGQQALDILQKNPAFSVVLMDCQMPVMDGYTATRQIREQLNLTDLPVIAMTAHAMKSEEEKCMASGMDDFIAKPFDVDFLYARLAHWISQKQTG